MWSGSVFVAALSRGLRGVGETVTGSLFAAAKFAPITAVFGSFKRPHIATLYDHCCLTENMVFYDFSTPLLVQLGSIEQAAKDSREDFLFWQMRCGRCGTISDTMRLLLPVAVYFYHPPPPQAIFNQVIRFSQHCTVLGKSREIIQDVHCPLFWIRLLCACLSASIRDIFLVRICATVRRTVGERMSALNVNSGLMEGVLRRSCTGACSVFAMRC